MGPDEMAEQDAFQRSYRPSQPLDDPDAAISAVGGNGLWATPGRAEPVVRAALARGFLWATAVACAGVVLLVVGTLGLAPLTAGSVAAFTVLALLALAATRLPDRGLHLALTAVHLAVVASILATGVVLGWGLAVPGLAAIGLLVCLLCAASGWQAGAFLAAVSALLFTAVALGWLPATGSAPLATPVLLQLGVLLIATAAGLAGGVLVSRLLNMARCTAEDREQRFRGLLALAVDGYWEIDRHYRLTAAADQTGTQRPLTAASGLGVVPWQLSHWHSEADALDLLLACLDERQPFRDIAFRWTGTNGNARHYRASGEPRFDRAGIFTGYWGVVRDISAEQEAQAALAATETRYRELFSRIPTPLVLHRSGQVIDANAAALALFGQPDLDSMAGTDLLSCYESGDSRERARRRMDLLHGQPLGTALPVTDFKLLLPPHRRVAVRATSVCVDAEGGPATLAIYVDDTERLAAEEAVRRSEAMLSHLVATSPDLITLTDVATGRYAMVNRSFERISGWTAAEAMGRTALELGIWGSAAARDTFVELLRREGTVTDLRVPFISKSGVAFSMVVSAARFVMEHRDYMVINARDVTEKERERLEREAILLNASVGIAVTRQQRLVLVNRHFEQIFGWPSGELLGRETKILWEPAHDLDEVRESLYAALARGEPVVLERTGQRPDGSTFAASIRGRVVDPARPVEGGAIWIVEDVTERRQFEQTLARARDQAESASRAKSAFLANTSHELRTPLNALIGLARLARDDQLAPGQRVRYLDQIEQSAQSLAAIISDILDLSRIEAGKLPIESAPFELAAELQALQRTGAVLAEGRPLSLRVQMDATVHGPVLGDALRLRQIVNNYLANAVKFTPQGSIWMRARRPGGAADPVVRIEVQDTGPGISAATMAQLFKPFTQADVSTTRRFGGTGLGLSICRELAALMGGRVGADSQEGQGSVFWVELPLPALPRTLPGTPPAGEGLPAGLPPTLPTVSPESGRSLKGLRVLIAEDNAVNMMIATALLERWGVDVTQALDGREAVAAVQRAAAGGRPFDAVLMDVQMPVMSGHEATRAVRELEACGALQDPEAARNAQPLKPGLPLPIIALTAAALVTEREEALLAGMNDFLTKPIDADKLQAALRRWCTR
jgi:PAS domain S-box-containing protein